MFHCQLEIEILFFNLCQTLFTDHEELFISYGCAAIISMFLSMVLRLHFFTFFRDDFVVHSWLSSYRAERARKILQWDVFWSNFCSYHVSIPFIFADSFQLCSPGAILFLLWSNHSWIRRSHLGDEQLAYLKMVCHFFPFNTSYRITLYSTLSVFQLLGRIILWLQFISFI